MCKSDLAVECFNKDFNCSQAVLATFSEEFGMSKETALRISCGFGSGMRMGETCGAVTGAIMAIGLKYGRAKVEDIDAKNKTYALVSEFLQVYRNKNGSVVCKELLGCDISTEEGMKEAREKEHFIKLCPRLVKDAVELLEDIL